MKLAVISEAYERKAELGGGFRGVVKDKRTGERFESPVYSDIGQARYWIRIKIADLMGEQAWAPGYVYKPTWKLNVYTA